ncbi:hypothetical protein HHL17_09835 [Chitinophaga sp. G-6-1-13]|uniref:Uncharacterized protein n=1 Tax=Chitinophaga fulva TaxID=2728842 RepID=A0A848GJB7_9BACT|nr:hypothetical protein [Chitinophaga fulva]NML37489.1 hypothetical protein [Chitinophaga fulva]
MNKVALNTLIRQGVFYGDLKVGLTKQDVESRLGHPLNDVYIDTPDLSHYILEMKDGQMLSALFDKKDVCFELKLDLEENKQVDIGLQWYDHWESINEDTSLERLLTILTDLNIDWEFDGQRVYLQTLCIQLNNGLRLYYAFGEKAQGDYGFFSIRSLWDSHELTRIDFSKD